ncbi:MAG: TraR/DksA C4-type zinc finger protein [Sphaerochaeta sp.]|jgi:RNA polymerase-binding protein DksA|nr:TraR/DksA C4-type zinc finger protein [Sphaerochaeta sp.]MCI2128710.1 TraR/DksA C4-type zinc finger protein [Sphaerochaeta sp.]
MTFNEEMEQKLLDMRKEILEHMAESNSEFKDIAGTMSIKDSIDSAADDIAIKKLEVINKHEANRLRAIEGALDRIHAGRYGTCLRCGKKIPEERLRALPYAVLCLDCKNEEERPHRY